MNKAFAISCLITLIPWNTKVSADDGIFIDQIEDFKTLLLTSDVFVDKSLLIKDFLSDYKVNRIVITRPHKWGKSINLDMLNTFFELEVDEKGVALPEEKRQNAKLFKGGEYDLGNGQKKTLQPLKIAKHPDTLYYQGKYPTIKISFKNIRAAEAMTYQEFIDRIALQLQAPLQGKHYLKKYCEDNNTILLTSEKSQLERYILGEPNQFDLRSNLNILVKVLSHHFNHTVNIFIDDYDNIITEAYKAFEETESYKSIFQMTKSMFSIFKDDPNVGYVLLTGKFMLPRYGPRASGMKILGLDNFYEFSLVEEQFIEHYGFVSTEVDTLLEKIPAAEKREIEKWYNGYNYAGYRFYNMWSLVNYLKKGHQFDSYWVKSGQLEPLEEELLTTDPLQIGMKALMNGTSIKAKLDKFVTAIEITQTQSVSDFYCLLFFRGYVHASVYPPYPSPRIPYDLSIPNEELKGFFKQRISEYD